MGIKPLKKLLTGILSVLLSVNAVAAQLTFEVYDSKLLSNPGGTNTFWDEEEIIHEQSSELYDLTLAVDDIGTFSSRLLHHEELLDSQGQAIGTYELMNAGALISPFTFSHLYSDDIDLMSAQYVKEDREDLVEYESGPNYKHLSVYHDTSDYWQENSLAASSYSDRSYLDISMNSHDDKYWYKNENGTITGQRLLNSS